MTRDQNLELIRAKCIEANPEIQGKPKPHGQFRTSENFDRPIRLADVLLAMRESFTDAGAQSGVSNFDYFVKAVAIVAGGGKGANSWNLRKDDINEQSDECITFLAELLN